MSTVYYDKDASLEPLVGTTIGIIGYGNQGRAQALNLRDSGISSILVGGVEDHYLEQAGDDGFITGTIREVSEKANILFMLIPDEVMPPVFTKEILPGLEEYDALNFASGYNIAFGKIEVPSWVDVIMVAPRMIGEGVRERYLDQRGFPSFLAVDQDASGQALERALALAKAIGATTKGAIEVTFQQEAFMDLFAEQATWPLIEKVLLSAFEFQIEKGLPPEAILSELYLSKEPAYIFDKMVDMGFFKQFFLHSRTSQYGQLSRLKRIDQTYIRQFMEQAYDEIESGSFAAEWELEQSRGLPTFQKLLKEAGRHPINTIEESMNRPPR